MFFLSFHNEDGDGDADNNKVGEDNDDNDDNCDDKDILDDDDSENVAHSRPSLVVAPHPATSTGLSLLKTRHDHYLDRFSASLRKQSGSGKLTNHYQPHLTLSTSL